MRVPLEISERADESVPFVKRASMNAPFQWKLGWSKIQMFSALERLCSRLFYGNKRSTLRFLMDWGHTPPYFHWNSRGKGRVSECEGESNKRGRL